MKEALSKRYSHGNENLGKELSNAAHKMNVNKKKGEVFDLIPQDMEVSKVTRHNEQYMNTFPNVDKSYSRERVNTSSHESSSHKKSEKEDNGSRGAVEQEPTAKMLINNPNLKKIKMFMEMESRSKTSDPTVMKSKTMNNESNIDGHGQERKPMVDVKVIPIKTNDANFKRKGSDYGGCIALPHNEELEEQEEIEVVKKSKGKEMHGVNEKRNTREDYDDNTEEQDSENREKNNKGKTSNNVNSKEIRKKKYLMKESNDNDDSQGKSRESANEKYVMKKHKQNEEEDKPAADNEDDNDDINEEHLRELERFMTQNDVNEVQFEEVHNNPDNQEEEPEEEVNEINNNDDQFDDNDEQLNEEDINEINNEVKQEEEQENEENEMVQKREMPQGHAEVKARYQTEENEQNDSEPMISKPYNQSKKTIQPDNDNYKHSNDYGEEDDLVKMQKTEENEFNPNTYNDPRLPLMSDIIGQDNKKRNRNDNNALPSQNPMTTTIPQPSIQYEHHTTNESKPETDSLPILNYDYAETIKSLDSYQSINKETIEKSSRPLKEEYKKHNNPITSDSRKQYEIGAFNDYKPKTYTKYDNNERPISRVVTEENHQKAQHSQQSTSHQYYHLQTEEPQEQPYLYTEIYSSNQPKKTKWRVLDKTTQILNKSFSQLQTVDKERKYENLRTKYITKEDDTNQIYTSRNHHTSIISSSPIDNSKYYSNCNSSRDHIYEYKSVMITPPEPIKINNKPNNKDSHNQRHIMNYPSKGRGNPINYSNDIKRRNIQVPTETDQEKFNLHYNYSNDPLYHKIRHNELMKQEHCPKKLNNTCIIAEDFIKNDELHQQIYANNYNDIDYFSNRNICSTSMTQEDAYPMKKKDVSPYFNYQKSPIHQSTNFYESKTSFYQEAPQQFHTRNRNQNQKCTCPSSREDLATLYLKAFPSFEFTRTIFDSPKSNPVQSYNKLCYKCRQDIREEDFMTSLL